MMERLLWLDLESVIGKIANMETSALPIDRMTIGEKLMAMEALWDSLCQDEAQIPVQEWHKQVLDERRRQIETGEAKFVDWETAKARIRDRIS
jgi:putative addiction module component (TIGR02574 family)